MPQNKGLRQFLRGCNSKIVKYFFTIRVIVSVVITLHNCTSTVFMIFRSILVITSFFVLATALFSCKKEKLLTTGGALEFSVDTLSFDTVFTKYASFTQEFKIYNPQGQKVNISSVRLEKGDNSFFKVNVNGIAGNNVQNIELAGKDSMYVFATVNIDPTNENNPFVVQDRMIVTMNGKEYYIPFRAFGQNAYYIINERLETQTWKTDKPYVVVSSAQVDSNHTLTIPAGCKVYMHGDSRLFVYGTLKVNGTKTDSVIFQGDRLDRDYFANKDFAGEWGGLYFFSSSNNNSINYAVIKNCGNGAFGATPAAVQLEPGALLLMTNSVIANSIGHGLLSFGGGFVLKNCLFHTCGAHTLAVLQGGSFDINHCTFALYSSGKINGLKHVDNPAVVIQNFFKNGETVYAGSLLQSRIRNSVIYGSIETELYCAKLNNDQVAYELELANCLYKRKENLPADLNIRETNTQNNKDPLFENIENWNYHLKSGSPAIDAGTATDVSTDLDGNARDAKPDLGCYEFH